MFVTLTFTSRDASGNLVNVPGPMERKRMLFAFLRRAAEGNKRDKKTNRRLDCVPWDSFFWVVREERGETGGRYHFHALLAGLPPSRRNNVERFSLKAIWSEVGGGFADVRSFDARLPGAAYVLKGLESWSHLNANAYELRRFDEDHLADRTLIVANACVRKWALRTKQRASGGTQSESSAVSLSARRKSGATRTKETLEELESRIRKNWLNHHPAGISFVR